MTDPVELVKALRQHRATNGVFCEISRADFNLMQQAADLIEAQAAQLADARTEADNLRNAYQGAQALLQQARDRFEQIRTLLIKRLEEPERSAFWIAVEGRDAIQPGDSHER